MKYLLIAFAFAFAVTGAACDTTKHKISNSDGVADAKKTDAVLTGIDNNILQLTKQVRELEQKVAELEAAERARRKPELEK